MTKPIDDSVMQQFFDLECQLSPENLHCDGEISRTEAQRKYVRLQKEWKVLEKTAGRKMESEEIWKWSEIQRARKITPR